MFPYQVSVESFEGLIDHGCGFCYAKTQWNVSWLRVRIFRYVIVSFETVTDEKKIAELNEWFENYNDNE